MVSNLKEKTAEGAGTASRCADMFDTGCFSASLKERAVRGGAATVIGQGAVRLINIGSTVVLARLLTPGDFGVIAMIVAVTGFMAMFKDLGLSMATIQRKDITHQQISNLFWVNVALSVLLAGAVAATAPVLVWFYGEPRLLWLTVALSIGFIFSGFATQHSALLQRQMRFATVQIVNVVAMLTGAVVGITAALAGAGVWSLAFMQLTGPLITPFMLWFACPWRPSLPIRRAGIRDILLFGGNITGCNILYYFSRNMDNILIGKYWGVGPLGLYSRAYSLLMLPIRQVTLPVSTVAVPTLSRLQGDPERYRRYYLKAISLIAFITIPIVTFMIIMSREVILLLLGSQWIEASRIFAILGVNALVQPILGSMGWLFISSGRTDRMLKWSVVSSICIVVSFVIGLPYGASGVATSYTVCVLLLAYPAMWYSCATTPVSPLGVLGAMWHPAVSAAVAGTFAVVFKWSLPQFSGGIVGLAFILTGMAAIYLVAACALARSFAPILQLTDLVRELKDRKPTSTG